VSTSIHQLKRAIAWAGSVVLLAGGAVAVAGVGPAAAASTATGGNGANLPYAEVLAQNSPTTGTVIGPSYTQGQLADEAIGREAVTLGSGQSVTFTTPVSTNSIDLRYSIPDSSSGSVYTAPISLYINGTKQPDLTLTNAYSWQYGSYEFTNTPSSGSPMHFFDEVHQLFSTTYPAGTTFKVQVDSEDTASSYTINTADFENVAAPLAQPAGSVSVTSEGADPTGVANSTAAFNAAITAAGAGGTVWIPPGSYNIPWHITVNNVTLEGAGMWYSNIIGQNPGIYGLGEPASCDVGGSGNTGVSTNVHLANFSISGNVQSRQDCDQYNGIGGAMSNSTISNIWIEHEKVGIWMDGPMTNLDISGVRIRDTFADGINLHGGVTDSTVTNSEIRNTGDDGIALWADTSLGADAQDTISDNTVQQNQLANGIAGYGGNNNTITGNLVEDTGINQGGGITVAQRFTSTPVGLYTISNNTMIRDGQLDPNWQFGVGALWFDGSQGAVTGPINVTNALIEQSPFEAIQWVEGTVSGVNLNDVSIIGTGTFALQEQTGGSATFTNVTATGVAQANLGNAPSYNCEGNGFVITDGGGNSGITPANCNVGDNPTPVYPPYPPSTVQTTPSALSFGSQATGTTSSAQTVTVSNPTSSAASVSSIAVSGPFAETNTCGSSIAAGGSCTASVTFKPTAAGSATGSLTVNAGGVTDTVALSGSGVAPGPVLTANPASVSFPATIVGSAAATKTVAIGNSGTATASISGISVSGPFTETNNCSSVAVGATCTATIGFTPTAAGTNTGSLTVTSNATNSPTSIGLSGSGIGSTTNLALNATLTASSTASGFPATDANDGNSSTYWESLDGSAYPQTLSANLGQSYPLGSVTLDLPPSSAWSTRSETLSVLGSTNGSSWTTLVPSASYTFNPSTGNTVSFNLPANSNYQYLELSFTGNTGWSAAQLSEFEIFPSTGTTTGGGSSATLTASPSSLSFGSENTGSTTAAQTVTIKNTGNATAALSAVSAPAPFGQTNTCGNSIAAGASCTASVTFSPTSAGAASGSLTVTSNATNSPLTVALSGTGASSSTTDLALNKPVTASSYTQTYVPANAVDGNTSTYWESTNGSWPATYTVNLGASTTLGNLVLDLPPATAWSTRTQTLSVLGSTNNSTWTTLVASATYTWNPSTGNTVSINLPAGTSDQYVELSFTANNVQNGAQLSELEVFS
jgi:F5/8 type C domain/Pectate lyase superfamily protein/Abnormal spindle-like microcephaly-assoc'd, ASPM-SPD-2-Hydin